MFEDTLMNVSHFSRISPLAKQQGCFGAQAGSCEQEKSLMAVAECHQVYNTELLIRRRIPSCLFNMYPFISSTCSPSSSTGGHKEG